jgi:hypothetical protein
MASDGPGHAGRVRTEEWGGDHAADGAHIHDSPASCAQQWKERLRDFDQSEEVDIEGLAQLVEIQQFHGSAVRDPGVVHEA